MPIKEKLDEEDYNRKIIVMGFGITDNGSDRASDVLQYATINKSDCTGSYNLYDKEKQFCAGGTRKKSVIFLLYFG